MSQPHPRSIYFFLFFFLAFAQYLDGYPQPVPPTYGPNNNGLCADVDTCDQQYNPTCAIGSPNYPVNPAITDTLYTNRANRCTANGPGYCSVFALWCCSVKQVSCSKNAEVVAYYDGSPPIFALTNEGDPNGITLTFQGAQAYIDDPFPCAGYTDPGTGLAPVRSLTIVIGCAPNVSTLSDATFYETSAGGSPTPCQYTVYTTSKYACGVLQPAVAPCSNCSSAPAAAAAAASWTAPGVVGAAAGGFFGGALAASLVAIAVTRLLGCGGGGGGGGGALSGANPFKGSSAGSAATERAPLMMMRSM